MEIKTALRWSYLHNGISYPGKVASLHYNNPQDEILWDLFPTLLTVCAENVPVKKLLHMKRN